MLNNPSRGFGYADVYTKTIQTLYAKMLDTAAEMLAYMRQHKYDIVNADFAIRSPEKPELIAKSERLLMAVSKIQAYDKSFSGFPDNATALSHIKLIQQAISGLYDYIAEVWPQIRIDMPW